MVRFFLTTFSFLSCFRKHFFCPPPPRGVVLTCSSCPFEKFSDATAASGCTPMRSCFRRSPWSLRKAAKSNPATDGKKTKRHSVRASQGLILWTQPRACDYGSETIIRAPKYMSFGPPFFLSSSAASSPRRKKGRMS